jgi:hypothetical protein
VEIKDILLELGYQPRDEGNYYRMSAIYRGGSNKTSLVVYKKDGGFSDYVTGETGTLEQLISKTRICSIDEAIKFCNQGSKVIKEGRKIAEIEPEIVFGKNEMKILLPIWDFYLKRGISVETLKFFRSGYCPSGNMSDRFVFPVLDENGRIVGVNGRDILGYRDNKWKKLGKSNTWDYPYYFVKEYLKDYNYIILVESIGDMLSLFEAGLKNVFVLFGKSLSKALLKRIVGINPKKIIVALNNDSDREDGLNPGLDGANKVKLSLSQFFDVKDIVIKMPQKKDFGEMTVEEIKIWHKTI